MGERKLIVIQHVDAKEKHLQLVKEAVFPYYEVSLYKEITSIPDLKNIEILFTYGKDLTEDILKSMVNLKWIQLTATGFDHLPIRYLQEKGIIVTTIKGAHAVSIAEYAMFCMLYFARKMDYYFKLQKEKIWDRTNFPSELAEKTVIIIGTGFLGKEIAKRAKAFEMKVIGLNRTGTGSSSFFDEIHSIDKLDMFLGIADYLILVCPLTKATYRLIGERELSLLSTDSVIINLGRGELLDEQAAVRALKNGSIKGMALDVFHLEPLPKSSPLWDAPNTIITPHMAARSDRFMDRCIEIFIRNCTRFISGDSLINIADFSKGY